MNKSEQAAKRGTDLANQAANTTVKTEDIETARTTAKAMGYSESTLDGLMSMFARNQNTYLATGGTDSATQGFLGTLYGYDQSGKRVEQFNTDPYKTIQGLAEILQGNSDTQRRLIVNRLSELGFDESSLNMLSNKDFSKRWAESREKAIYSAQRTEQSRQANAAITNSDKSFQNEWDKLGLALAPVRIKLNELGGKLLKEVNKMTPLIEEAMPGLEKVADFILKWVKQILNKLVKYGVISKEDSFVYQPSKSRLDNFYNTTDEYTKDDKDYNKSMRDKLQKIDDKIDYATDERVYFNDGSNYTKGTTPWGIKDYEKEYYNFIIDQVGRGNYSFPSPDLKRVDDDLLQTGQQLMQNSTSSISNSTSQVINIENMNVNTDSNNAQEIVQNSVKDTQILTMSGSAAMPFMYNYS